MKSLTIAAIATPQGNGGVGIVRVSGPLSSAIAQSILKKEIKTRYAHYGAFYAADNQMIDQGVALFFQKPHSFTGEDVIEFHAHGGQVVLDELLKQTFLLGAILAQPGEFTQRAFLNEKIDLTQAEAIADLISASSAQAARAAVHSLQGVFSEKINQITTEILNLRKFVEAAMDFSEEEIDFLTENNVKDALENLIEKIKSIQKTAQQGALLKSGMTVVIAGLPNAGKSSLLNCLAEKDIAIVSDIAGTTRDVLREHIHIDGLPLHIIDTAGLHPHGDTIEKEGIRRALMNIENADCILLVVDSSQIKTNQIEKLWPIEICPLPPLSKIILIRNKIDLVSEFPADKALCPVIDISAKNKIGIESLRNYLKTSMGYQDIQEDQFIARKRHLEAIQRGLIALQHARFQLVENQAIELFAQELRIAHEALSEITGKFTSNDLLGEIFSSFCVGK